MYGYMDKDQTTAPGTTCPTLYDDCVGSLTSPASHYSKDAGDGAYGLDDICYYFKAIVVIRIETAPAKS